jgi:hypothetical protein
MYPKVAAPVKSPVRLIRHMVVGEAHSAMGVVIGHDPKGIAIICSA